ncbi:DUF932 domain-containing protein [Massilia sp. TS11]|uniref:DUF932 domain-containing protein n=1 Tax=Massilia sp. TS11 TaxID=2908003 RepID=UPI001EDC73CB|nr:DUF932 domain-containing protein [Massilia sp. TS11]MCG2583902.1 DUF932 domain-containing protein [Massilia sp. TS11]
MKHGRSLTSLAEELTRQLNSKRDLVVPATQFAHHTDLLGVSKVTINEPQAPVDYLVNPVARRQLAEKLKIPFNYFERMRVEEPQLLDHNVNTWLHAGGESYLMRTLDRRLRAVLSKRYRRIDNFQVADRVIPILDQLPGATFTSVELTETRMYLKVVSRKIEHEIVPGDVVQAGVVVSNSEVGCGRLWVQPLVYRLKCGNGMIAVDQRLAKTHLGRLLEASEDTFVVFQDDTLRAEDEALLLAVRDAVQAAVSEATLSLLADKMRKTLGIPLRGDPAKSVEVLADRFALSGLEQTGILRFLVSGGSLTGYGLLNAVTDFSKDVEDYDRATELEMLGGRLIEMSPTEWNGIADAA